MSFASAHQLIQGLEDLNLEEDEELKLLARFSPVRLVFNIDAEQFVIDLGKTEQDVEEVTLSGSLGDWSGLLQLSPRPQYNGLLALNKYSSTFTIDSDLEAAIRHLRTLNRWCGAAREGLEGEGVSTGADIRAELPDLNNGPVGRYVTCEIAGERQTIYYESAGEGPAVVCLHTAGSDSRQYHDMMADPELTGRYRVIAFDLPGHGKSMPADKWWLREYRLTRSLYIETVRAFCRALHLDAPTVVGCSMAGSLVLHLALDHPDEFTGVIGFSGAAKVTGRFADWSLHADVNAHQSIPSWTYGLMAPQSPEHSKRSVWWHYAQGGPGMYRGDTYFYSEDSDLRGRIGEIDTEACPVYLWTGEYDHACTPEDTWRTLKENSGIRGGILADIGHFPVAENYSLVRPLIHGALADISGADSLT
ncbi:alpha/beta fold hydrolase [Paenarthrobacter sp. NPDC090520]|uniref:alpha/beta fold hydrolase n=1 Tax=unclassified Paenarthrobacter TaxID=2634190 RepID=UPI0038276FDA